MNQQYCMADLYASSSWARGAWLLVATAQLLLLEHRQVWHDPRRRRARVDPQRDAVGDLLGHKVGVLGRFLGWCVGVVGGWVGGGRRRDERESRGARGAQHTHTRKRARAQKKKQARGAQTLLPRLS